MNTATRTPRRRRFSAVVSLAMVGLAVAGCASTGGPAPLPHATSQADALQRLGSCMQERGWDVVVGDDSVQSPEVPPEQTTVYNRDTDECSTGLYPDSAAYSDEQWQELYDLTVANADCYEKAGFDVSDRPSFQVFKDTRGEWNVPAQVVESGQMYWSELDRMNDTCPQPDYWG